VDLPLSAVVFLEELLCVPKTGLPPVLGVSAPLDSHPRLCMPRVNSDAFDLAVRICLAPTVAQTDIEDRLKPSVELLDCVDMAAISGGTEGKTVREALSETLCFTEDFAAAAAGDKETQYMCAIELDGELVLQRKTCPEQTQDDTVILPCFPRQIADEDSPIFLTLKKCLDDSLAIIPRSQEANLEAVDCMVHVRSNGFSMKAVKERQCFIDANAADKDILTAELLCKAANDDSGLMNEARLCIPKAGDVTDVGVRSGVADDSLFGDKICLATVDGAIGLLARKCLRDRMVQVLAEEVEFLPCLPQEPEASELTLSQCLMEEDGGAEDVALPVGGEGDHLCLSSAGPDEPALVLQRRFCSEDGTDSNMEILPCVQLNEDSLSVDREGLPLSLKSCMPAPEESTESPIVSVRTLGGDDDDGNQDQGDLIVDKMCIANLEDTPFTLSKRQCFRASEIQIAGISIQMEPLPCFGRSGDEGAFGVPEGGVPLEEFQCLPAEDSPPSIAESIFLDATPAPAEGNRRFLCAFLPDSLESPAAFRLDQRECSIAPAGTTSSLEDQLPCVPLGSAGSVFIPENGREATFRTCQDAPTLPTSPRIGVVDDDAEVKICLDTSEEGSLSIAAKVCTPADEESPGQPGEVSFCLNSPFGAPLPVPPRPFELNFCQESDGESLLTLPDSLPSEDEFLCLVPSEEGELALEARNCESEEESDEDQLLPCIDVGRNRPNFLVSPEGLDLSIRRCSPRGGEEAATRNGNENASLSSRLCLAVSPSDRNLILKKKTCFEEQPEDDEDNIQFLPCLSQMEDDEGGFSFRLSASDFTPTACSTDDEEEEETILSLPQQVPARGQRGFMCLVPGEGGLRIDQRECSLTSLVTENDEFLPCSPLGGVRRLTLGPDGLPFNLRSCRRTASPLGLPEPVVPRMQGMGPDEPQDIDSMDLEAKVCLSADINSSLALTKRMCLTPDDVMSNVEGAEIVPCLQENDIGTGSLTLMLTPCSMAEDAGEEDVELQLSGEQEENFLCLESQGSEGGLGIGQRECSEDPGLNENSEILPCVSLAEESSISVTSSGSPLTLRSCSRLEDEEDISTRTAQSQSIDDLNLSAKLCMVTGNGGNLRIRRKMCLPNEDIASAITDGEFLPCADTSLGDENELEVGNDVLRFSISQCSTEEDDEISASLRLSTALPARGQRRFICAVADKDAAVGLAQRECSIRPPLTSNDAGNELLPCLALGTRSSLSLPPNGRRLRIRSCQLPLTRSPVTFPDGTPGAGAAGEPVAPEEVVEKLCLDSGRGEEEGRLRLKKRVCRANGEDALPDQDVETILCIAKSENDRFVLPEEGSPTSLTECFVDDIGAAISDEEIILEGDSAYEYLCMAADDEEIGRISWMRKNCSTNGQPPGETVEFLPCVQIGQGEMITLSASGSPIQIRQCSIEPRRRPLLERAQNDVEVIRLGERPRVCVSTPANDSSTLTLAVRNCVDEQEEEPFEDDQEILTCLSEDGLQSGSLELFSCSTLRPEGDLTLNLPEMPADAIQSLAASLASPSLCLATNEDQLALKPRMCGSQGQEDLLTSQGVEFLPCLRLAPGGGVLRVVGELALAVLPCFEQEDTEEVLCLDRSMAPELGLKKRKCFPLGESARIGAEEAQCLGTGVVEEGLISVMDLIENPLRSRLCLVEDEDYYDYLEEEEVEENVSHNGSSLLEQHVCFLEEGGSEDRLCFQSRPALLPEDAPIERLFCQLGPRDDRSYSATGPQPQFVTCLTRGGDSNAARIRLTAILGSSLSRQFSGDVCDAARRALDEVRRILAETEDNLDASAFLTLDEEELTSFAGNLSEENVEEALKCLVARFPNIFQV